LQAIDRFHQGPPSATIPQGFLHFQPSFIHLDLFLVAVFAKLSVPASETTASDASASKPYGTTALPLVFFAITAP
jgi:hypothetical protein